jgi:ectoine hydroxylase-related dioxygenase (phytanoyl-CoA dioxygenase family)
VVKSVFKGIDMIVTTRVKELVTQIESTGLLQPYFPQLLKELQQNCQHTSASPLHPTHSSHHLHPGHTDLSTYNNNKTYTYTYPYFYPIDSEGYAIALDPLEDEELIRQYWHDYGFVVAKNIVSPETLTHSLQQIEQKISQLGMDLSHPESFVVDSQQTPILTRGFFELYHDDCLAQLRQSLRLYLFQVILWHNPFLWTSFDRLGIKTPSEEGLNLHVDQNPVVHPEFRTIQGVLALVDCPVERGTFVASPGSKSQFSTYIKHVAPGYQGEYMPLPESRYTEFPIQHIALRQGSMVSWDSRTTHANSSNISDKIRYVAYLSTGLAKEHRVDLIEKRKQAFASGLGENVRDAYMHASKKPRFTDSALIKQIRTPEALTLLGQCLYGFESWQGIMEQNNHDEDNDTDVLADLPSPFSLIFTLKEALS